MIMKRILLPVACVLLMAGPVVAATATQADLDAARTRVTQSPDSADAQFDLAMAYARTPFLEQGWEALKRVNALDPAYADKAVAKYEAAVAANPADPEAHFRLAFGYYFQNKKDQARAQMEQVVAIAPQDPWGYDYLGFLVAEQNQTQLDEAAKLWQKALEMDPNNAVAHYLIGQVYYRQGKFMQAAGEIASALKARTSSGLSP
jgi:tetratricopeptide (TPR) repeat protein